jgi:hypothetical protein
LQEDDDPRIREAPETVFTGAFSYGDGLEGRQFVDGFSKTIFLGEVDYSGGTITEEACPRFETSNECRECARICIGASRDHAFLGSDDLDLETDYSEFFCSTAIPINSVRASVPCEPTGVRCTTHVPIERYELMYGAAHRGVAMFSFGDGSARAISERIDDAVFRALGSRYGSEANHALE